MSVCDKTCRGCAYGSVTSMWGISCNYILVTGHPRGCPAGAGCTRRLTGDRLLTVDQLIMMPLRAVKPTEKRREKKQETPEERSARRHRYMEHVREQLAGRQREVIVKYRDEHRLTTREMAQMIGVNVKTLDSWACERCRAKWEKLEPLGIARPEGL